MHGQAGSAAYLRNMTEEQLGLLWIVSSERLRGSIRNELTDRAAARGQAPTRVSPATEHHARVAAA